MPLTPLDVENLRLRTSLRGYDRDAVDAFHREVVDSLEEYVDQVARLKVRIKELEAQLSRAREQEDGVKGSLLLAQRTADELVSAARERAEALLQQARSDAAELRRGAADIVAQREQFEFQFHGLLTGFLRRLEQSNPQLSGGAYGRAEALPQPVVLAMDTPHPTQPEHDLDIDMVDLTVQPVDVVEHEDDGEDTVVLPMAAPLITPSVSDYARRLDSDNVAFTAALDSAALRPELLAEAQVPVSGSNVHELAEQVVIPGNDEATKTLEEISDERLREEADREQGQVHDEK